MPRSATTPPTVPPAMAPTFVSLGDWLVGCGAVDVAVAAPGTNLVAVGILGMFVPDQ